MPSVTDTAETRAVYFAERRERFAHYAAKTRDNLRNETFEAYGGKCKHCGESDPIVLCIDHIFDDAAVEIELYGANARGGTKQYGRLKKAGWPQDRFQLLCYNCNAKKENKRRRNKMIDRVGTEEIVDKSAAHANVPPPAHNSSGIKGVLWNSQRKKWQARVMINYQNIHLGFHADIRQAAYAYAKKARELWGDMALVASEEEIDKAIAYHSQPSIANKTADELGL